MTHPPVPILYTIPNFISAGSGHAMTSVVFRLDRTRFAPSIAVLRTGGSLEARIAEQGIPLLEGPITVAPRPLLTLPGRIRSAAAVFRPYGFRIWHSFHYSDDYTEPLIARAAGAQAWIYEKKNMSWSGRAWKVRSLLATRIAAQNSTMLDRFFASRLFRSRARLIPPGVDTEHFRPGVPPDLELRARLHLKPNSFLIGCVAHLLPVKGHPTLIRAVASIPEAHLVLAGRPEDPAYTDTLHALCVELDVADRVHFLGAVANIPALHAEIDVFVLPSLAKYRMEGCPVAMMEAMACGVPAVVSNIPGPDDVITSGENGILVPPEDVDALAAALKELQQNPERRSALGEAGRQRILANYRIEDEVARHEAVYADILGW